MNSVWGLIPNPLFLLGGFPDIPTVGWFSWLAERLKGWYTMSCDTQKGLGTRIYCTAVASHRMSTVKNLFCAGGNDLEKIRLQDIHDTSSIQLYTPRTTAES